MKQCIGVILLAMGVCMFLGSFFMFSVSITINPPIVGPVALVIGLFLSIMGTAGFFFIVWGGVKLLEDWWTGG